jgi:putative membrane protein
MSHHHLQKTLVAALALALAGGLPLASQAMGDKSTGDKNATSTSSSKMSSSQASTSTQAQSTLSSSDKKFVEEAGNGGLAEVQFGQLAEQKAQNADVKQFGQRMVTDHSKVNDKLKQVASQKNVNLPTALEGSERREYDKLQKLSGAKFDQEYMKTMVSDHEKDIKAFQKEAKSAKDPDVKSFADSTLPTLQQHLQQAKSAEASAKKEKS